MNKKYIFIIIFIFIVLVIIAGIYKFNFTNSDIYTIDEEGETILHDDIKDAQTKSIENNTATEQNIAKQNTPMSYRVEFIPSWSTTTHPDNYPTGAHFSPFVAYSHDNSDGALIYKIDSIATKGVEIMAETGATKELIGEIQEKIDAQYAFNQTLGSRVDLPGTDSSTLKVSPQHSNVTFVSMIAPSPDWFVAASTDLIQNDQWIDSVEVPLITYDSGTDTGENFTSPDIKTQPKAPIAKFDDSLQNLGTILITKVQE